MATNLRQALAEYSPSDRDQAGVPIEDVVAVMLKEHDIVRSLLHGCDYDSSPHLSPADRLAQHAHVLDFVMADPDRAASFLGQVLALAEAFALCGARDEAAAIRNDVRLVTAVRAAILKIQNPDSGLVFPKDMATPPGYWPPRAPTLGVGTTGWSGGPKIPRRNHG